MSDDPDGTLAALGRLGTQITMLADQLGTILHRSEEVPMPARAMLAARMDRSPDTAARLRHDGLLQGGARSDVRRARPTTRADVGAVTETISVLGKRLRLLEVDVRALKADPRCWIGYLLN